MLDVLLGCFFNIFELTIFKRNRGLFPYPDNQVKKEKKGETKTHKESFSSLPWTGHRHLAEDRTQTISKYW